MTGDRSDGPVAIHEGACVRPFADLANRLPPTDENIDPIQFDMNNSRNQSTAQRIPWTGVLVAAGSMLLMVGCGGGAGESPQYRQLDAGQVAQRTQSEMPQESVADQGKRAPGILMQAVSSGSIIPSMIFGRLGESPLQVPVQCQGSNCSVSVPAIGFSYAVDLQAAAAPPAEVITVLTRQGITTLYYGDEAQETDYNTRLYGAWMHHGGFMVGTLEGELSGASLTGSVALSGGDLTGSSPSGGAIWKGIMVGAPQGGTDLLQGDAELTYTIADGNSQLDAEFTEIMNLDEGTAHSVPSVSFMGVTVGPTGIYEHTDEGDRIQGRFYGTDHAETAGTFEKSGIVAAFGARKD